MQHATLAALHAGAPLATRLQRISEQLAVAGAGALLIVLLLFPWH